MIPLNKIPERVTTRLNETERMNIHLLSKLLNEDDIAKVIKFGLSTALHHIDNVTNTLVSNEYDVIFQRKRKTQKVDRKFF